jgi:hypothetical protein
VPNVLRDSSGRIRAVFSEPGCPACSQIDENAPELLEFLAQHTDNPLSSAKDALNFTDCELVRVIEDIVEVLIEKNLIMFTDLPEAAQNKISSRTRIRHDLRRLRSLENVMLGENDIL